MKAPSGAAFLATLRGRWLLVAVFILGCALRLYPLQETSLWYDEAGTLFLTRHADLALSAMNPDKNYDAPVFLYVMRGWSALVQGVFGLDRLSAANDFMLRLFPCLMGILSMPLLHRVTMLITGNATAAISAVVLFAISPFYVQYAHELRNYSLWTLWSLLVVWSVLRALDLNRRRDWVVMTLVMLPLMYLHYASLWLLMAYNAYFFLTAWWRKDRFWPWFVSQAVLGLCSLPSILLAMRISGYYELIQQDWYPRPDWKTGLLTFKAFFAGYGPSAAAYWAIFALAAGLCVAGVVALRARFERAVLLLTLLLLPITAGVVMWRMQDFSLYEHRVFACSGMAAFMLAGAGASLLPRWARALALGGIAVATVPCLADTFADRIHPIETHRVAIWQRVDFRSAARHLTQRREPGDVLGHASHFSWFPMKHYFPHDQFLVGQTQADDDWMVGNFGYAPPVHDAFGHVTPLQVLGAQYRRLWLIETHGLTFADPQRTALLRRWLELHGVREDCQTFAGVTLSCYRLHPEMPGTLREQTADFGAIPAVGYPEQGTAVDSPAGFPAEAESWGARLVPHTGPKPVQKGAFQVLLSNAAPAPRRVLYEMMESEATLESSAFDFVDPMRTVWQRGLQYNPANPPLPFQAPVLTAHMREGQGEGDGIRAWVELPPGRFMVRARMLEYPGARDFAQGQAEFRLGDGVLLTRETDGVSPGAPGWKWRALGGFEWSGGRVPMEVRCRNRHALPDAYISLDRVLFTRVPKDGSSQVWRSGAELVTMPPNTEIRVSFLPLTADHIPGRVELRFLELEKLGVRYLSFAGPSMHVP